MGAAVAAAAGLRLALEAGAAVGVGAAEGRTGSAAGSALEASVAGMTVGGGAAWSVARAGIRGRAGLPRAEDGGDWLLDQGPQRLEPERAQ